MQWSAEDVAGVAVGEGAEIKRSGKMRTKYEKIVVYMSVSGDVDMRGW